MAMHLCNKHFTFNLKIYKSLEKFSHYVAQTFAESATEESFKKKSSGNHMDVKYLSWEWECDLSTV